jgi:hypothetical protein
MRSIAIDPQTSRVFWTSEQPPPHISWTSLGGGGGADLQTGGADLNFPDSIVVLRGPAAANPPSISGGSRVGGTLTCSQGGWAADQPATLFYRAPQSFSFRWLLGDTAVAQGPSPTLSPARAGRYTCEVTATNFAGSATQATLPVTVLPALAKANRVALVKRGKALLRLTCPAPTEPCPGRVRLGPLLKAKGIAVNTLSYGQAKFHIGPGKGRVLRVKLDPPVMSQLAASRRHRLKVSLGGEGVEARRILLKLVRISGKRR